MRELIELWKELLGEPPIGEQFKVWTALYTPEIVKQAILRTAAKNLSLGNTMSPEYKTRFASKVMIVQTERKAANAANRARLCEQFEGAQR